MKMVRHHKLEKKRKKNSQVMKFEILQPVRCYRQASQGEVQCLTTRRLAGERARRLLPPRVFFDLLGYNYNFQ